MNNILFVVSLLSVSCVYGFDWPVPYQPVASRPANDPYCQAGLIPFCPSGKSTDQLPVMKDDDIVEVFALKKPVWSFQFGPLMGYFGIWHDGLGFRNARTGLNYTMEWYELDQLFNCTFPHLINDSSLTWCNQGALCSYDGINDTVWTEYGSIVKVSEINGTQFNDFANWAYNDNNTAVYYETWTVYNTDNLNDPRLTMYFDSFDCASWTLRAFEHMYARGARFDPSAHLNYTRLNLYGYEPTLLGSFGQVATNETLLADMLQFYSYFQKLDSKNYVERLEHILNEILIRREFYFYYNSEYWFIKLKAPFVKPTFYPIPLPGTTDKLAQVDPHYFM